MDVAPRKERTRNWRACNAGLCWKQAAVARLVHLARQAFAVSEELEVSRGPRERKGIERTERRCSRLDDLHEDADEPLA